MRPLKELLARHGLTALSTGLAIDAFIQSRKNRPTGLITREEILALLQERQLNARIGSYNNLPGLRPAQISNGNLN